MKNSQKTWLWLSAIVSFVVGFILVMNDSSAGWFLIIMGIVYIGSLTRPGQTWAEANPRATRWAFIGITIALVLIVVITGAALLLT
jgi:uncharacterized membrane protein HdeD (DUF308 family)